MRSPWDETRLGLKTETGRVITARGVKPIVSVQWPRKAFWLYGVVEPLKGWHFCQEYPHLDSENFQKFLDALSLELSDDTDFTPAHQIGCESLRILSNIVSNCDRVYANWRLPDIESLDDERPSKFCQLVQPK